MKRTPSPPEPGNWTRGGFLLVVAVLFAGQAGLLLLFAERARPSPVPTDRRAVVRLMGAPLSVEDLSKFIFAADPTVFPSSAPHGFADQAWLKAPALEYKLRERSNAPSFLEFAASQIGANLIPPGPAPPRIPFALAEQQGPSFQAAPSFSATAPGLPESFFRIEGDLAARLIEAPAALRAWPSANLLPNSVVQFAVNRAGQVVSARLWAGSGLPDADTNAVATVGALRFRPAAKNPAELAWTTATFYWKTIEPPPGANAPAGAVPGAPP